MRRPRGQERRQPAGGDSLPDHGRPVLHEIGRAQEGRGNAAVRQALLQHPVHPYPAAAAGKIGADRRQRNQLGHAGGHGGARHGLGDPVGEFEQIGPPVLLRADDIGAAHARQDARQSVRIGQVGLNDLGATRGPGPAPGGIAQHHAHRQARAQQRVGRGGSGAAGGAEHGIRQRIAHS